MFDTQLELETHEKKNHRTDMPVPSCEVCNLSFSDLRGLQQHKQAYQVSVQVNIGAEDVYSIVCCDLCPYSC